MDNKMNLYGVKANVMEMKVISPSPTPLPSREGEGEWYSVKGRDKVVVFHYVTEVLLLLW